MRNRYVDLLRFLAIIRVVVYHTSGWAFLTMVFPAMTVMFALAGSFMAASLDRSGRSAVGRRLRRLLSSFWMLAAVFVPAMLLTGLPVSWQLVLWALPVADPPTNSWGALALSAIWYLRDYLWFVLVSPLALWLFRRYPLPTLLAPYALLAVVELGFPSAPPVVRDFGLYFGAWLLGFAHYDGMLRRLSRRILVPTAVTLGALGAAWIVSHPGPRGYDLNDIPLGNSLWSAGFTLLLLGLAPASARWMDRSALLSRAVTVLNRRALTVYLWHMPIVVGVTAVTIAAGWGVQRTIGIRLAVVAALVVVAVALFGWVEDVSARRRPVLLPGRGHVPGGIPRQATPAEVDDATGSRDADAPTADRMVRAG